MGHQEGAGGSHGVCVQVGAPGRDTWGVPVQGVLGRGAWGEGPWRWGNRGGC